MGAPKGTNCWSYEGTWTYTETYSHICNYVSNYWAHWGIFTHRTTRDHNGQLAWEVIAVAKTISQMEAHGQI